mmetsp:Transcript_2750/g.9674  ORF Transcript_2750/g.9674 Transcript_2750/m.9674 type:complete len:443 (+) Transcript_2750:34-1362(+)
MKSSGADNVIPVAETRAKEGYGAKRQAADLVESGTKETDAELSAWVLATKAAKADWNSGGSSSGREWSCARGLAPVALQFVLPDGRLVQERFCVDAAISDSEASVLAEAVCSESGLEGRSPTKEAIKKKVRSAAARWLAACAKHSKVARKGERVERISLDVLVGDKWRLQDQVEWDLYSSFASPEDFALSLCADLGLSNIEGAVPAVAHAVRAALLATLETLDAEVPKASRASNTRKAHIQVDETAGPRLTAVSPEEVKQLQCRTWGELPSACFPVQQYEARQRSVAAAGTPGHQQPPSSLEPLEEVLPARKTASQRFHASVHVPPAGQSYKPEFRGVVVPRSSARKSSLQVSASMQPRSLQPPPPPLLHMQALPQSLPLFRQPQVHTNMKHLAWDGDHLSPDTTRQLQPSQFHHLHATSARHDRELHGSNMDDYLSENLHS